MKTKPKTLPPRELEQDWYPNKPDMEPDARIKRIMAHNNTRFKKLLEEIPKNEHATPEFSKVFTLKNKVWKHTGYKCMNCGKLYSDQSILEQHPQICSNSLKINNQEEQHILSRVKRKQNASTQDE